MKIFLLTIFFYVTFFSVSLAQEINGVIVSDTSNFKIIKVWGSHYERGYAVGYLDGARMIDLYEHYIVPSFGQAGIDTLKKYIEEEKHFVIPQRYHTEAQGIADGIIEAKHTDKEFTYLDVLAANTFFDFIGFLSKNDQHTFGCSSLMDWGDATMSTDLEGASVISRHVDWTPNSYLISSSSVIAHIPSEENEQEWVMIGFAGQMSALSGVNVSSLAVFHHSLADFYGTAKKNKAYEPVWFTARNALESHDFNNDGFINTNDVRDAVNLNPNGYANGSILCALSLCDITFDSLTALVVESACEAPFHTYRYTDYDDLIPGDNLYAANASIKRNDAQNYEPRYMNIVNNIGDGTLIDDEVNWNLMRDYSNSQSYNIQFMQFLTEGRILKLSVADDKNYAYEKEPVCISIDSLFIIPEPGVVQSVLPDQIIISPNPVQKGERIRISMPPNETVETEIINIQGKTLVKRKQDQHIFEMPVDLEKGIYLIRFSLKESEIIKKLIVN